MRGSDFVSDYIQLLYCKCHKPFTNKFNWEGINYPSEKND